jgi:hypothetical protein
MEAPEFWNEPSIAQKKMKELKSLKDDVATFATLATSFDDIETMIEMGYEENDASLIPEIQAMLDEIFFGREEDWPFDDVPEEDVNYMAYPGGLLFGDASNDTIHMLKVNQTTSEAVLSFDFVGTGFEILSRTTAPVAYDDEGNPISSYAVLTVRVDRIDENNNLKFYKAIPVITESYGGDLTQIPLVVLKNLEYGHYKVTVLTSNVREQIRFFFVDGIRIYQPLTDDQEALYYKADEKNVTFTEIKTEISKGNIVYGTISRSKTPDETVEYIRTWAYGDTMIEDRDGNYTLVGTVPGDLDENGLSPYEQYMYYGPNNEIYLSAINGGRMSYIAFYVTKDENYVGERSIQVGAHCKYPSEYSESSNTVSLLYGESALGIVNWDNYLTVCSGTEQYFSIDLNFAVPCIENGTEKYLVIIGTDDNVGNILSLTNLKLNGYSILGEGTVAAELEAIQDVSDVKASLLASETYELACRYTQAD